MIPIRDAKKVVTKRRISIGDKSLTNRFVFKMQASRDYTVWIESRHFKTVSGYLNLDICFRPNLWTPPSWLPGLEIH